MAADSATVHLRAVHFARFERLMAVNVDGADRVLVHAETLQTLTNLQYLHLKQVQLCETASQHEEEDVVEHEVEVDKTSQNITVVVRGFFNFLSM